MSEYDIAERLRIMEDDRTNSLRTIEIEHAYVHKGKFQEAWVSDTGSASISKYVIATPTTTSIHFKTARVAIPKGTLHFTLWEDATSTGGSTWGDITPYNHQRIFGSTSAVSVYSEATSTGGIAISNWTVWAGTGPQSKVGESAPGNPNEWVLKKGTEYRLAYDTTEQMSFGFFWYEVDD